MADADPFSRPVVVPTPEEWIRILLERRRRNRLGRKDQFKVAAEVGLKEADAIDRWLRLGTKQVPVEDLDVVIELAQRHPADLVDPQETPLVKAQRDSALASLLGELILEKIRRKSA